MKPTGRRETVTERKKSGFAAGNCVKLSRIFKKSVSEGEKKPSSSNRTAMSLIIFNTLS